MVVVPLTAAVGLALTVTTAPPVRSPAWAVHLESVSAVTVYVVVVEGLTLRVAGLEATPFWVVPSDQVTFHGPVPVRSACIVVEVPLQTVALSALRTAAFGRGLNVCVPLALPEPVGVGLATTFAGAVALTLIACPPVADAAMSTVIQK
jgi:hypothetical protein